MIRQDEELYSFDTQWEMSRKNFLKALLLGTVAVSLPLISCEERDEKVVYKNIAPLTQAQYKTLRAVLQTLFPKTKSAPGALDVNADRYFIWLINDIRTNPRENDFLVKKLSFIHEESINEYDEPFYALSKENQYDFLKKFANEGWKKRWTSRMMTILFEAVLLDPIYGINTDEKGWKWLNHLPGQPRPTDKNKYPVLLDREKKC